MKTADIFRVNNSEKRMMQIILFICSFIWLFPAYSALKQSLLFNGWGNYISVFTTKIAGVSVFSTLGNSFYVALIHSIIVVGIAAMSGYAFSKMHFVGKKILYVVVISFMSVPITVMIAPLFFTLTRMNIINTRASIFLPEAALTLPFSVLMMRNFFDSLPNELMESAYMDGAGDFRIFTRIYMPLSTPALLNLSVLSFMWSFKDYLTPALFTSDPKLMTATLAVSRFKDSLGGTPDNLGRYYAAMVVIAVPIIVLFSFFQKFMRSGMTAGAIKG
ncbi:MULTISPECIES: carbohydrate ABC transporter permease [unclassified Oceanispirochaeta]|uniref:carbohydrate ABC transporter permease n=1 Tax=unclassified Oceanispirochaeta TaxID=2635722 RepID=UPI000E09B513|nr:MULTISPECIES: carbohydrate ABC transporter permease [unclassified Oceanispirochaeta]MBF9018181.1 carbohydrate ABC transporter permease [Oceanispirochaeta sp. M2]NPD74636.1 carbohydrate ABC transporter permease [Oceanispirochaeta sp. M1]RDG29506.1 carbohydrate ABC transporter permease [Oceanispirochaeta sp. M1]